MNGDRYIRRRIVVRALPPGCEFPIDMLRYDNCVPASEKDANAIQGLGYGYDRGCSGNHRTIVTLYRFVRFDPVADGIYAGDFGGLDPGPDHGKLHKNSHDRWRSKFHWEIVEDALDE